MGKDICKLRRKQKLNVNNNSNKMTNIFFTNPNLKFEILNEGLTKVQIDSVIPQDFKGKNDFVQFYLLHNGVCFTEGAEVSTEQFSGEENDEYYELEVESIYRIDQIQKIWEALKERSSEAKKFVETHIPFAGDAAGNDFFIEIPTGIIKYISWEYDIEEGLIDVANNFKEFCLAIEPLN